MIRCLLAALSLLLVLAPPTVRADGDPDDTGVQPQAPPSRFAELMEQGQRALEAKDHAEACRLFGLAIREPGADKEAATARFREAIRHVGIYNTRFGELKTKTMAAHGTSRSADAIALGLQWLVAQQAEDGRWPHAIRRDYRYEDVATTSLALLALMADGNSEIVGPYQQAVRRGLAWLLDQQTDSGSFAGGSNYTEGLAALAVVEAFAMGGTDRSYGAAQKSLEYILNTRSPNGGWNYRSPEGDGGDVSVSGMMFQPLKQAQAAWLDFNYETAAELSQWIARITPDDGRVPYRQNRWSHYHDPSMAAIGSLIRIYAGSDPAKDEELARSVKAVLDRREDQRHHVYFQYYGTMITFLTGGETWTQWRDVMLDSILSKQATAETAGPLRGRIFDEDDFWVTRGYMDPIVYHTMALLSLECSYRYVPPEHLPREGESESEGEDQGEADNPDDSGSDGE